MSSTKASADDFAWYHSEGDDVPIATNTPLPPKNMSDAPEIGRPPRRTAVLNNPYITGAFKPDVARLVGNISSSKTDGAAQRTRTGSLNTKKTVSDGLGKRKALQSNSNLNASKKQKLTDVSPNQTNSTLDDNAHAEVHEKSSYSSTSLCESTTLESGNQSDGEENPVSIRPIIRRVQLPQQEIPEDVSDDEHGDDDEYNEEELDAMAAQDYSVSALYSLEPALIHMHSIEATSFWRGTLG